MNLKGQVRIPLHPALLGGSFSLWTPVILQVTCVWVKPLKPGRTVTIQKPSFLLYTYKSHISKMLCIFSLERKRAEVQRRRKWSAPLPMLPLFWNFLPTSSRPVSCSSSVKILQGVFLHVSPLSFLLFTHPLDSWQFSLVYLKFFFESTDRKSVV